MRKTGWLHVVMIGMLTLMLGGVYFVPAKAAETKTVKMGTTVSVSKKGASYKSSDPSVAYVSEAGRITGKKQGKAVITVKTSGKEKKISVTVAPNGKKSAISVCADELAITDNKMTFDQPVSGDASYKATVTLKNNGKKSVKKVTLETKIGKEKVIFFFGTIPAGKSKCISKTGVIKEQNTMLTYKKLTAVSDKMLVGYRYAAEKTIYDYGTKDKKAPVITGFVGENSYNQSMPYQVVYSTNKSYNFLKYVSATDDRDGKVKITVDDSKINWKKTGTYKVFYTATDKAGNEAKAWAKIGIRVAGKADQMADSVLKSITKSSWSNEKKARAIYNYTRGHIAYTGYSDKSSWEREAINGMRSGSGDCFTYYAVARILLTRAGIPNICVRRVRGHGNHWWNMVYVRDGFYHFDTCPRLSGGRFCLVTDSQLTAYSNGNGNSHIWDYKHIPKSAAKKISSVR